MKDARGPFRPIIHLDQISHLFTKVLIPGDQSEIDAIPTKKYGLWEGWPQRHYPPWVIVDRDGYINEKKLDLCLVPLDLKEIAEIWRDVPKHQSKKIVAIAGAWKPLPEDEKGRPYLSEREIADRKLFMTPVPKLRDPSYLEDFKWLEFVDRVVSPNSLADPRLLVVHRTRLFRGIDVKTNPNCIEVTNGGTSKSTFAQKIGQLIDKATPKTFLGFAKSPEEIFPGFCDGQEEPVHIDQLESQGATELLRYLFNLLESGYATVLAGATSFRVRMSSILTIYANPIGSTKEPAKSFATLMHHLSFNSAIGRRFPLIVYGTDFKELTNRLDNEEEAKWASDIQEFRAVEEYAWGELQAIVHSPQIWKWLNQGIPDYARQVEDYIGKVNEGFIVSFFRAHTNAQVRLRGAALYASLTDHLAEVALKRYELDSILDDAEDYLNQLVQLNLISISRICDQWSRESSTLKSAYYKNLPNYLREIVSAVELYRRENKGTSTLLTSIPYRPKDPSYRTLNECTRKFQSKKNQDRILGELKEQFGFDLMKAPEGWKVTILKADHIQEIDPLGVLDHFDHFDYSTTVSDTISSSETSSAQSGIVVESSNPSNPSKTGATESEYAIARAGSIGGPPLGQVTPSVETVEGTCNRCGSSGAKPHVTQSGVIYLHETCEASWGGKL